MIGSNDGLVTAFLIREKEYVNVDFYIRLVDAKKESTFERMKEFFEHCPRKRAFINAKPVLCTLDMSHLSLKIPIDDAIEFLVWEDGRVETNFQLPIK